MKYTVENLLPADFLLKQGIYIQTCAHIELLSWRITQMLAGYDPSSRTDIEEYISLKLQTRGLVSRLRKSAIGSKPGIGVRVVMLADRIKAGLDNRNMAAHGAWRLSPPPLPHGQRSAPLRAIHLLRLVGLEDHPAVCADQLEPVPPRHGRSTGALRPAVDRMAPTLGWYLPAALLARATRLGFLTLCPDHCRPRRDIAGVRAMLSVGPLAFRNRLAAPDTTRGQIQPLASAAI